MKHTALIAALLASVALPALATGRGDNGPSTRAEASARQAQGQAQRQGQRQSQVARGGSARSTATGGRGGSARVTGTQTTQVSVTGASAAPAGGTTTLRTAPDVAAPAIWSNNPCIVSASGSVSVVGFGASIGAGIEDPDCTRRANAQLLAVMGQPEAAREVLCANREVRAAFLRAGRPCAADQGAPTQQPAATTPPVATVVTTAPRPAFCATPGLNIASYPECQR